MSLVLPTHVYSIMVVSRDMLDVLKTLDKKKMLKKVDVAKVKTLPFDSTAPKEGGLSCSTTVPFEVWTVGFKRSTPHEKYS